MEQNKLEYHPHKTEFLFVPFLVASSLFLTMLFGYFLHSFKPVQIVVLIVIALNLILIKTFDDNSKRMIIFEEDGLRIIGEKNKGCNFLSWKSFTYAYNYLNIRGHRFWILSSNKMSEKEIKKLINTSMGKIAYDDVVVIHIDDISKEKRVKANRIDKIIKEKIPDVIEKK